MKQLKCLLFLVVFSFPAIVFADLTGKWSCNDGGTYYMRQLGKEVFWMGERAPTNPSWSNPNRATATYKTGGFGGSVWTRP